MKRNHKIGDKFNKWTVIGFNKEKKKYICECVCSNISYVSSSALISGKSKSCGCGQKDFVYEKLNKNNYLSIRNKIFDNYRNAAKRRNYDFKLSKEQFSKLILQNCFYCNASPNMTYKYGKGIKIIIDYSDFKYNGVDRIDNNLGYTIDNCRSCCKICNNSKSTLSEKEWIDWISKFINHDYFKKFND